MLAQRGVRCLVLDRWPDVYVLPRAVHFGDGRYRAQKPPGSGRRDGFAIITRRSGDADAFEPQMRAFFDAIGTTFVPLGSPAAGAVTDLDGTLTALLDKARADALLLRPDRVVAACADRADLRAWRRLLETAGITATGEGRRPRD